MKWVIGYIVMGVVTIALSTGWQMAEAPHRYPYTLKAIGYRAMLGRKIMEGTFYGFVWPVGLPAIYCLTGFAEYGWSVMPQEKP